MRIRGSKYQLVESVNNLGPFLDASLCIVAAVEGKSFETATLLLAELLGNAANLFIAVIAERK